MFAAEETIGLASSCVLFAGTVYFLSRMLSVTLLGVLLHTLTRLWPAMERECAELDAGPPF